MNIFIYRRYASLIKNLKAEECDASKA